MTTADTAAQILRHGIQPIPLPFQSKKPTLPDWPQLRITAETLPQYFNNRPCNIGGLLGDPSQGIIDVDLDWPEAGQLAQLLLPKSWTFGRSGQLRHVLVRSPGTSTTKFDAPVSMAPGDTDKRRIVEVLGTGAQAMMPTSTHPNGERIEWLTAPEQIALAELDSEQLLSRVSALAGAALLVRLWPDLEGTRHDVALALAGALHHAAWPVKRIETLLVALLRVANDPERLDRAKAAADTLRAAQDGKPITGLPRLAELLPGDVLDLLVRWWKLGSSGPVLTFGGTPAGVSIDSQYPPLASAWPELLEFESGDYSGADHPYPVDKLGPLLGGAVEAIVHRQQVPAALAAQSVLAAAGTTVHSVFDIEADGRIMPLSLWLVLIAEPGERKTSSDDIAFGRLRLRMSEAQQRYRVALDGWKAAKSDKEAGDPGPRPRNPLWLLTDTTTEGLLKCLDRHWPALCLTNSDAAAWLNGYSMREGRDSATAATLSALWSGSFHAGARASMDEPVTLINRRLSLSLMLQPAMAAQLFESATLAGQGFLSRCLPAFPRSTIGNRGYRRAQPDERLERFYAAQDRLLLQPPNMVLETGELQPTALPLTDEALSAWIDHHDEFESELIGDYSSIREVANKAPEQILRLAGVRAALEGQDRIDRQPIDDAAALVSWYLVEWQTLTGKLMGHRKDISQPQLLLLWMRERRSKTGETLFRLSDIYRSGPRIVRNQSQLAQNLMLELQRRGYVRWTGRQYELRPESEL